MAVLTLLRLERWVRAGRLRRFKALVDAAVFLDIPGYEQPEPRTYPYEAVARVMADKYGAEWDPDCVAAQSVLQARSG